MWYTFSLFWKVFWNFYFPIGWFVSFLSICKNFFWPIGGHCKLCVLPYILWKYFPQIMVSTQFAFCHRVFQSHILKSGFISFKASAPHCIHCWLHWVFVAVPGLSLATDSRGHSLAVACGRSLQRLLLFQSTSSRHTGFSSSRHMGSVVAVHRLCFSTVCGTFPDQGSNSCPWIGRWISIFHTTREIPALHLDFKISTANALNFLKYYNNFLTFKCIILVKFRWL